MSESEAAMEELAIRFVLGEMGPDEARDFRAQLQRDPELSLIVASVADTFGAVAESVPQVAPPASLRGKVLASIAQVAPPRRGASPAPWISLAAAAAMTVLAAIGWSRLVKSERNFEQARATVASVISEREQLEDHVADLEQTLAAAQSANDLSEVQIASLRSELEQAYVATLAWSQQQQKGMLDISHLPPIQPGQSYQLWIIDENNAVPVSAGVFSNAADGMVRQPFAPAASIHNPVAFAISLEKEGGVPTREGPIIVSQGL
jgi:anti-sigma-K factor RskA